jgi:hypothetical protein
MMRKSLLKELGRIINIRNRKFVWTISLFLSIVLISGCGLSLIRSYNRNSLMKLSPKMTKKEVLDVMGTTTIPTLDGIITNPYRSETVRTKNGSFVEILFYYTDIKKSDGAITDDELTPIVFVDGKVTGWGWSFLNQSAERYEFTIRNR